MTNAMPSRPNPTRLSTDFIFVYVAPFIDTTGETVDQITPAEWGMPLPNITGHTSSEDADDSEWRHYATGPQTEVDVVTVPVTLTLEASANLDELGAILGCAAAATPISLIDSSKVHVAMVGFSSSSGNPVVETEYWEAIGWSSLGSSGSAGTSVAYKGYELSGKAEKRFITDGSEAYNPTFTV